MSVKCVAKENGKSLSLLKWTTAAKLNARIPSPSPPPHPLHLLSRDSAGST